MCKKIKVDSYVNIEKKKKTYNASKPIFDCTKKKVFWYLDVCNPSSKFYKVKWRRPSRNFYKNFLLRINILDGLKVLGNEIVQLYKLFWLAKISRWHWKTAYHAIIFTFHVHYFLQGEKLINYHFRLLWNSKDGDIFFRGKWNQHLITNLINF